MSHFSSKALPVFLMASSFQLAGNGQNAAFPFAEEMCYTPQATTFTLHANDVKAVTLRIFNSDSAEKPKRKVKMRQQESGRWTATVEKDLKGCFYTFEVDGHSPYGDTLIANCLHQNYDFRPRPMGQTPGMFAKAVGVNGKRAAIIDMKQTDPEGWEHDQRPLLESPNSMVVYELHLRDFSMSDDAPFKYHGKYLTLTETAAIDYLKRLGVNAVQLMPVQDFATVDEAHPEKRQYNWGYDPLNCNVPEGSYATDAADPACRIREFKQMVQALHQAGIRVIMDVVYNHCFTVGSSHFNLTSPGYYFRTDKDGRLSNGSGCGNETASEKPLMRQFILESVRYWAQEYHVDGFRFDLMGVHDVETMNLVRKTLDEIDPSITIHGEGWAAAPCAWPDEFLAMKANMRQMPRIAAFGDELRNGLLPLDVRQREGLLLGDEKAVGLVQMGVAGAIGHPQIQESSGNAVLAPWAAQPTQMVAYVSCHDGLCLADRIKAFLPEAPDDELVRLNMLAAAAVFTSQGIPFFFCGDEMMRTRQGHDNPYNQLDAINAVPWRLLAQNQDVFGYYAGLIQLRKQHPAFRMTSAEQVRQHLEFLPAEGAVVAFCLKGHAGGDNCEEIYVILNGMSETARLQIPEGLYKVLAKGYEVNHQGIEVADGGNIAVAPQSALILAKP